MSTTATFATFLGRSHCRHSHDPGASVELMVFIAILFVLALLLSDCVENIGITNPSWSDAYDADWKAVCNCWKAEPEKPIVIVRTDCKNCGNGVQCFRFPNKESEYATGEIHGVTIEVCPDLKALRHEMSHYVSMLVRGTYGVNGEGVCAL